MVLSAIYDDIDFLCGSTSASYPTGSKQRNINIAYADVARVIWDSAGGWQYDDSNTETLPVAYTDFVDQQQDYQLPSTCQRVERVEVQDAAGNWKKLSQIDLGDVSIAMQEFNETAGEPRYYDIFGNSLMFYPKPSTSSVTEASGIAVYVSRDVTNLTAASSSPGFATPFHRILSYAAALDFVQDDSERKFLAGQRARLENGLTRFYSKRNVERGAEINPAGKKLWRQYT